jgi:hypothetical protein
LARVFEECGLATLSIALVREHVEKVKPPRTLFVPFPLGWPLGKPNDAEFQHKVIRAAFDLLDYQDGPVLVDFPEEVETSAELPQASQVQADSGPAEGDPANEVTALRPFYERWLEAQGGRTAVGLSGVPQRRFRGMVRAMQSYVQGEEADFEALPEDMTVHQYLRYCIDDLKAFFYEARMMQRPTATQLDLHAWFWGETAAGHLVAAIAQRMNESEDPRIKGIAFGIAR